jgi:hypothetical protein
VRLRAVLVAAGLVASVLAAGPAFADRKDRDRDKDSERSDETPWSKGVSKAAQKKALDLFQRGNELFEQARYTEALGEYERALKSWDHPNIRFNLAVCLINIRQPLVAWDHLQSALRFGEGPLGKRLFAEAMTYQRLLESSLAELTVVTEQPDVTVMLDGTELFVGANKKTLRVLAGSHQLVATRTGYQTDSRALDLPAGKTTTETIELMPERVEKVEVNYERRWAWWVPWTIAGSGVAVGLGGIGFYASARSDMRTYDQRLEDQCPTGCLPEAIPASTRAKKTDAERNSAIAIGMWTVGGAVVATAAVMAILNRPKPIGEKPTPMVTVAPGYVGIDVALTW